MASHDRKLTYNLLEARSVRLMLEKDDVNKMLEEAGYSLLNSASLGCTTSVHPLLTYPQVYPTVPNNTVVRNAVNGNHTEIVLMLLDEKQRAIR